MLADTRVPKYWEYAGGIYFKVLDEEFLAAHQGERLRFWKTAPISSTPASGCPVPARAVTGAPRRSVTCRCSPKSC